jgi:hypothetical protein
MTGGADDIKVLALYLPQFHPIPENDKWWGKGFTEWTNVARAKSLFDGHHQPQIPADLGFYDLRLRETRHQQVELAKTYGIHGFCFYYYWFAGRRVLERPLDEFASDVDLDFPFCVCWANENWTRRWDGAEHEVLLGQNHTPETDRAILDDLLPLLKNPRYIHVDGRPLFVVYRPSLIPNIERTAESWRAAAQRAGLPGLYLCTVEAFGHSFTNPCRIGFDAAMEFPPHGFGFSCPNIAPTIPHLPAAFTGKILDYHAMVDQFINRRTPPYKLFRGVAPSWDNSARRGLNATIFTHASPEAFAVWLSFAVDYTVRHHPPHERLIFVNAWNEWAEGAHLEPDQKNGHRYLENLRCAVADSSGRRRLLAELADLNDNSHEQRLHHFDRLRAQIEVNLAPLTSSARAHEPKRETHSVFLPESACPGLMGVLIPGGVICFEKINRFDMAAREITLDPRRLAYFRGWAHLPNSFGADVRVVLALIDESNSQSYFAVVPVREVRTDVPNRPADEIGFELYATLDAVPPGHYRLAIIQEPKNTACGVIRFAPVWICLRENSEVIPFDKHRCAA